nr:MAG TPA: DNA gyrase inhibitor [Caudoviricetes sp.]
MVRRTSRGSSFYGYTPFCSRSCALRDSLPM